MNHICKFSSECQHISYWKIKSHFEELKSKGATVKSIAQQGSIAKVAHIEDPDGLDIAVVQWNDGFEEKENLIKIWAMNQSLLSHR